MFKMFFNSLIDKADKNKPRLYVAMQIFVNKLALYFPSVVQCWSPCLSTFSTKEIKNVIKNAKKLFYVWIKRLRIWIICITRRLVLVKTGRRGVFVVHP